MEYPLDQENKLIAFSYPPRYYGPKLPSHQTLSQPVLMKLLALSNKVKASKTQPYL